MQLLVPDLPSYAHYVWHTQPSSCGAWGMLGWLLGQEGGAGSAGQLRTSRPVRQYVHYLLVESSARGPYLPAYMPRSMWSDAFTRWAPQWAGACGGHHCSAAH